MKKIYRIRNTAASTELFFSSLAKVKHHLESWNERSGHKEHVYYPEKVPRKMGAFGGNIVIGKNLLNEGPTQFHTLDQIIVR